MNLPPVMPARPDLGPITGDGRGRADERAAPGEWVRVRVGRAGRAAAAGVLTAAVMSVAWAQTQSAADLFRDGDLALGEKLYAEHKCAQCHARSFGDDGNAIYRPKGRINAPGVLRGMVEQCNTQLSLGLFPEEVTSVAAVLNRDHYRFK